MTKDRQSNIELLRILAMLLIVAYHCALSTNFYQNAAYDRGIILVLGIWGVLGVDCFYIISFNFLQESTFKTKKLVHLLVEILFYVLTFSIIYIFYQKYKTNNDILEISKYMFIAGVKQPFWQNVYWFITIYLLIYISFPIINKFLKCFNKKQLKTTIIIGTCIIFFYQMTETVIEDYFFAVYTYILIYYLKNYKENILNKNCILGFIFTTILILCLRTIDIYTNHSILLINIISGKFGRLSLLFLIDAIFLFYIFKNINLKTSKKINAIASTTLGIYLFHESEIFCMENYVFMHLENAYYKANNANIPYVFIIYIIEIVILFLSGSIIDFIRQLSFKKLQSVIDTKLIKKYEKIEKIINVEGKM